MSTSSCHPAAVASVGGLVLFGTTTSLLAKIGEQQQRATEEKRELKKAKALDDG